VNPKAPSRTRRLSGTVVSVVVFALCLCDDARSESPQRTKEDRRWRWELGWGICGDMHDAQGLIRREGGVGSAVLNIEPGPVLEARLGWEAVPGLFALRGGLDTAEFSIDDVFGIYSSDPEPSFSGSFRVAEGRWTAIRLEALWLTELSDRTWGSLFAGPVWHRIGSVRESPAASAAYGLTSVSSTSGFTGVFGADWHWRLGESRWALGFSGAWQFGAGPGVRFETDEAAPFDSGSVSFRPWSISLRLSRVLKGEFPREGAPAVVDRRF